MSAMTGCGPAKNRQDFPVVLVFVYCCYAMMGFAALYPSYVLRAVTPWLLVYIQNP
jgi:hypothetical protein